MPRVLDIVARGILSNIAAGFIESARARFVGFSITASNAVAPRGFKLQFLCRII